MLFWIDMSCWRMMFVVEDLFIICDKEKFGHLQLFIWHAAWVFVNGYCANFGEEKRYSSCM